MGFFPSVSAGVLNSGVQSQLPSLLFVGSAFQVVDWLVFLLLFVLFQSRTQVPRLALNSTV